MIGIMIPVYNRPEYFQQVIDTLLVSNLPACMVCIVDDGSNNPELIKMYRHFILQKIPMIKVVKERNVGMWDSMRIGFDLLIKYGCTALVNLDSDAIVKPNWLLEMTKLYNMYPGCMITGFNNAKRPAIKDLGHCYERDCVGGISQMFSKQFYIEYIQPHLIDNTWDNRVGMNMIKNKIKCYATKPSVIQHLGKKGKNSNENTYDYAEDF